MHKIVVGITGASGAIYAKLLLEKLGSLGEQIETVGIVKSANADVVSKEELGNNIYEKLPFQTYASQDFHAPFASGSAQYNTMIVCPCSMGTLARIANGISNDLMTRAADVILKERRKLILITRETPLNLIHIKNMQAVTEAGGIICPATPSFYSRPSTVEEVAETVINRALDLAGLSVSGFRWSED